MFTQQDYQLILKHFETIDPKIYQLLDKLKYLKPLPKRNLFSTLIATIIGQKIRFKMARNLRGKLYTILKTDNFTSENIIDLGKDNLLKIGLASNIAELIYNIAEKIESKEIKLENLNDIRNLKIKGIGPWTINNIILMYTMSNDEDVDDTLLYEDLIIRRGIKKLYNITSKKDVEKLSQQWIPYRGIVTWYLWSEYT